MRAITIKNIPDELYERLKLTATLHRRSLNSELIVCLETVLSTRKFTAREHIASAQQIRRRLENFNVSEEELHKARNLDRP
jgi:plasmid stability protein